MDARTNHHGRYIDRSQPSLDEAGVVIVDRRREDGYVATLSLRVNMSIVKI